MINCIHLFVINRSGVLLTFVCNDRMSNALDAFKTTGNNVIDEAKGFMQQTLTVHECIYLCENLSNEDTNVQNNKLS